MAETRRSLDSRGASPFEAPTVTADTGVSRTPRRLIAGDVFGSYRIVRLLGRGGMGDVYEAEHVGRDTHVALKLSRRALDLEADRVRFHTKGKLQLRSAIRTWFMCWRAEEIDGIPVIVTELVSGGTLRDRVAREGPLAAADAVDAILQVIAGLQAAGDAGVLHRDVKPSNCFVGPDGHIKIGDFGIAIATRASDDTHVSVAHLSPARLRLPRQSNSAATRSTSARTFIRWAPRSTTF
jgi:eukaryotic-like serine/threonine-protein kinase